MPSAGFSARVCRGGGGGSPGSGGGGALTCKTKSLGNLEGEGSQEGGFPEDSFASPLLSQTETQRRKATASGGVGGCKLWSSEEGGEQRRVGRMEEEVVCGRSS